MPLWLISLGLGAKKVVSSIPPQVWLIICIVIAVLVIGWRVEGAIKMHYAYVHELEKAKADLTDQNKRLNDRVNQEADINKKNKATYDEQLRQKDASLQIANRERADAEKRAALYKDARNAANSTPQADRHPVSPVVQSTVEKLWANQ